MTMILECKSFPKKPATVPMSVVLRDFGEGHHHRYVTHCRNDDDGSHFWGHYFKDEDRAREDFAERCQRYA